MGQIGVKHKNAYQVTHGIVSYLDEPQAALFELLSDGDVAGDSYYTVDSEDNYIQIDNYNEKTKEIKGIFQLTLIAQKPRSSNLLPDTLRLQNGRFHTRIIEYKGRGG
ncbi:hypothetical protein [Dyadobacter sp. OTU695]|uniref:hypothetical protein n=1 Tax=Dyadobacter sp. OTU695 TaxID=3043860 RepID=UPI00313AD914